MKIKGFDSTKTETGAKGAEPEKPEGSKPFFGIKSYIHQFYQQPTASLDVEGDFWYLSPSSGSSRRALYVCRACTIIGLALLLLGAAGIILGYTWPHHNFNEDLLKLEYNKDENGDIWVPRESLMKLLRDPMRPWKLAGLGIFTVGGIILAVSLLIPTCASCFSSEFAAGLSSEPETPIEPPIRIYPTASGTQTKNGSEEKEMPKSPTEKVPVMEAVSKVQPEEEGSGSVVQQRRISTDELLLAEQE